jgi:DNA-binding protein H-NS
MMIAAMAAAVSTASTLRLYRAAWACRVDRPWRKASDRRQGREVRYATIDTISSSVKFATTFAISGLHDPAGEGKKKPDRAVKYRGPQGEVWTGVGAMAGWLKKLKDAGEDIERFRVSLENPTLNIIC